MNSSRFQEQWSWKVTLLVSFILVFQQILQGESWFIVTELLFSFQRPWWRVICQNFKQVHHFFFLGWQLYQRMEPGKYGTSMVSLSDTTIFRQSCPLYWLYRFVPPQKARFLSGFWIGSELILGTVSKKSQESMFILLVFSSANQD